MFYKHFYTLWMNEMFIHPPLIEVPSAEKQVWKSVIKFNIRRVHDFASQFVQFDSYNILFNKNVKNILNIFFQRSKIDMTLILQLVLNLISQYIVLTVLTVICVLYYRSIVYIEMKVKPSRTPNFFFHSFYWFFVYSMFCLIVVYKAKSNHILVLLLIDIAS